MQSKPIAQLSREPVINLALDTISQKKQALVFVNSKRSAERTAEEISRKIKDTKPEWNEAADKILHALSSPTKQCERLAACVRKGVAFHHAGLTQKQREIIEMGFKQLQIPIICCTPTLASGVDLPAFRAIIKDLKRYGSPRGLTPIPVLEYHQMAGRAGRPKYDAYGEAICFAQSEAEAEQIVERYLHGQPEDILSKLAVEPVLRTYILTLIATKFVNTRARALDFFSKTFWAHQFKDMQELARIVDKMLGLLEEYQFIRTAGTQNFSSAKELADGSLTATLIGERVAQLYLDPLTAHEIILALQTGKPISDFTLFHLAATCLEMRPLLRVKVREYDNIQEKLTSHYGTLLRMEPSVYDPEYEEYLAGFKTALFLNDWAEEKTEEQLLEQYDIRPGEIRAKLDRADWLLYATAELASLLKLHAIRKAVLRARFRLKYGVQEELLTLLKLEGIGRVRARKLFNAKIRDLGDVQQTYVTVLAQLIGRETAYKVKKQVGQDMGKVIVPEHKRKGQISLKDYGG
ncbi:MAG TPA: helicase-related protein [Candidatus Nanoarchaeia archaeon]|nr:helicase-related protein [Candidatus Nanoarchaeia archaeon]